MYISLPQHAYPPQRHIIFLLFLAIFHRFSSSHSKARLTQTERCGHVVQIVATVPDLIAVLDAQSGCALGTPDYKYGLRVLVLGITAAPQWTNTERGLELGDLRAFGYVILRTSIFLLGDCVAGLWEVS